MLFHGFQGSTVKGPVVPNAGGVLPLKEPLLDPSRLLCYFVDFHGVRMFFDDLVRFYEIHGFQGSGVEEPLVPNADGVLS